MKETFVYKEVNGCVIQGDYYPIEERLAPLVVYIHGGGLIWGSRSDMKKEQISLYQQAGFNVCSVDYRLAPESKLPAIKEDLQDMLTWLKKDGAERFGYDPNRIAVIGSSAGAYLALLAGTLQDRPKAVVSFYGYGDITGEWYQKPSSHFLKMPFVPEMLAQQLVQKKTISEAPIERRYAIYLYCRQQGKWLDYAVGPDARHSTDSLGHLCPLNQVDKDYPPTMLLHGDEDEDVPYEQSVMMSEALTKVGVVNHLVTIPDGKHSFDDHMADPVVKKAFGQVIDFLKEKI